MHPWKQLIADLLELVNEKDRYLHEELHSGPYEPSDDIQEISKRVDKVIAPNPNKEVEGAYGYVDPYGNFEFDMHDWMLEEPGVEWTPVFKLKEEPDAWLVPSLVTFKNVKKVHFFRTEAGMNKTDAELMAELEGTVLWSAETVFFNDGAPSKDGTIVEGGGVKDKDGVVHLPVPLYGIEK